MPGKALKRRLTYVLEQFGELVRRTPMQLPAVVPAAELELEQHTFTVIAGASSSGAGAHLALPRGWDSSIAVGS